MASSQTSGAVTVDGRIFTWGLGCYYALGLGTMENVNAPTEVTARSLHIITTCGHRAHQDLQNVCH